MKPDHPDHVDPVDPFDLWLRDALHRDPEPDDAGFSLRVMAALPPHAPAAGRTAAPWRRQALALAMAAAGIGLGALALFGGAWPWIEQGLAAGSLLGLLLWWSLPQTQDSGWR